MSNILDRASFVWGAAPAYNAGNSLAIKPLTGDGIIPTVRASDKWVFDKSGTLVKRNANEIANEWDSDGSYKGTLIEPEATNYVRNNTMQGAVVGGALPTFWALQTTRGLTITTEAVGVLNGIPYIDINFLGTADSSGVIQLFPNGSNNTVIGSEVASNHSCWIQTIKGSITIDISYLVFLTAGGFSGQPQSTIVEDGTFKRFFIAYTTSETQNAVRPQYRIREIVSGESYDFTIRFGLPQVELGSIPTSSILTTGASATRLADVIQKGNFENLINVNEGTIVVELKKSNSNNTGGTQTILGFGTATSQRISFQCVNDNNVKFTARKDGVSRTVSSSIDVTTVRQIIGTYSNTTGLKLYIDGVFIGEDTTANAIPTNLSVINIGKVEGLSNTGQYLDGNIGSIIIFPEVLTDEEIANIPRIAYKD